MFYFLFILESVGTCETSSCNSTPSKGFVQSKTDSNTSTPHRIKPAVLGTTPKATPSPKPRRVALTTLSTPDKKSTPSKNGTAPEKEETASIEKESIPEKVSVSDQKEIDPENKQESNKETDSMPEKDPLTTSKECASEEKSDQP